MGCRVVSCRVETSQVEFGLMLLCTCCIQAIHANICGPLHTLLTVAHLRQALSILHCFRATVSLPDAPVIGNKSINGRVLSSLQLDSTRHDSTRSTCRAHILSPLRRVTVDFLMTCLNYRADLDTAFNSVALIMKI